MSYGPVDPWRELALLIAHDRIKPGADGTIPDLVDAATQIEAWLRRAPPPSEASAAARPHIVADDDDGESRHG